MLPEPRLRAEANRIVPSSIAMPPVVVIEVDPPTSTSPADVFTIGLVPPIAYVAPVTVPLVQDCTDEPVAVMPPCCRSIVPP